VYEFLEGSGRVVPALDKDRHMAKGFALLVRLRVQQKRGAGDLLIRPHAQVSLHVSQQRQ
jgi:hypothetical protein